MSRALRHPLRESAFFLAGFAILSVPLRLVWLSLAGGAPPAGFLHLWFDDLAAGLLLSTVWLLVSIGLPGRGARWAVAGFLLAQAGLWSIASTKYYLNYETPFRLSHLAHVEGATQMTQSIASEITGTVAVGALLVVCFSATWAWLGARLPATAVSIESLAGRLPGFLGTAVASAVLLGLVHLITPTGPEQERGYNLLYRVTLAGSTHSGPRVAGGLDAAIATNNEPFRFRFGSNSVENPKRLPRLPFPDKGKQFNIVIYLFEGTSAEYIGRRVNGRSVTPNWERFAQNSLRMRNHHASNPLTINALFSILTSAFPLPADRWVIKDHPDLPVASLPEALRRVGYRTGILNTGYFKYAGQDRFLGRRGFDLMMDVNQLRKPPYTYALNWGIDDRALIGPALEFARVGTNRPFFLLLKPETPHHPYDVPEDRFYLTRPERVTGARERSLAKYENALYFADHVMGETVRAFEEAGFADNTLFFLIADHGEAFGQHRGNYNHPFFVYQENMHVPFLIYNRRLFRTGMDVDRITRHVDVPITVLDIVGLAPSPEQQGVSFLRAGFEQMAFFNTTWRNDLIGLRDGRWKYIYNLKSGQSELYDLSRDAREQYNLAQTEAQLLDLYRTRLFAFRAHQRKWYEKVAGRPIDWSLTMSKDGL